MAHCVPASLSGAHRPVEDARLSWVMLHQLCLCSADEIWMPEESAENAEGSQGTYRDVLVLQVTHTLYLRVKTCTVVCIWC